MSPGGSRKVEEQSMRGEGGGVTVPEVQEEVEGAGGREPGPPDPRLA